MSALDGFEDISSGEHQNLLIHMRSPLLQILIKAIVGETLDEKSGIEPIRETAKRLLSAPVEVSGGKIQNSPRRLFGIHGIK